MFRWFPKLFTDLKDIPSPVANKYLKRNSSNDGFEWGSVDPYTSGNLSKRLHYIPKQAKAFGLPYYSGKYVALSSPGLLFAGGYLWGANGGANKVYQIDVKTCTIIANITVSNPTSNGNASFCYDGTKYLWVLSSNGLAITKIDTTTSPPQVVATISFGSGVYCYFTPVCDGTNIWFSTSNNVVHKLNSQNNTETTYSSTTLPICFDGTYLWGTNNSTLNLYKLNTSWQVVGQVGMPYMSYGNCFDGTHVWVVQLSGTNIYKVDVNTMGSTAISLGTQGYGVGFDGTHVWVGIPNGIKIINIVTHAISTITLTAIGALNAFDGTHMWYMYNNNLYRFPVK